MADSSQDAAKLLLQVRRIAIDELIRDNDGEGVAHPVTPLHRPRETVSIPRHFSLSDIVSPRSILQQNIDTPTTDTRFRAISICSQDFEEPTMNGHVTPLQQGLVVKGAPDSPNPRSEESTGKHARLLPVRSKNDDHEEDEEEAADELLLADETQDYAALYPNKFVGESLPVGVKARDVLRKKFSWKSFPELESYLVDHRLKYLECSNALNYTKAQKHYNNQLTQGLLDLAAEEGYLFEGFTFAAVRDRIRCFYKSFVQATKKKKRLKIQKRGRSVTM